MAAEGLARSGPQSLFLDRQLIRQLDSSTLASRRDRYGIPSFLAVQYISIFKFFPLDKVTSRCQDAVASLPAILLRAQNIYLIAHNGPPLPMAASSARSSSTGPRLGSSI